MRASILSNASIHKLETTDRTPVQSPFSEETFDIKLARKFLEDLFEPDDLIEVKFVETWNEDGQIKSGPTVRRVYSRSDAVKLLASWTTRNGEPSFDNVLVGVCKRPTMEPVAADEIKSMPGVWCHIRGELPYEDLHQQIEFMGLPEPSWIVRGPSDLHCFWLFQAPVSINDLEARRRMHRRLREIAKQLSGEKCSLDSFVPLPGFPSMHGVRKGQLPAPWHGTRSDQRIQSFYDLEICIDKALGKIQYPDPTTEPPDRKTTTIAPHVVKRAREILARPPAVDPIERDIEAVRYLALSNVGYDECLNIVRGHGGFTDADAEHFAMIWCAAQAARSLMMDEHPIRKFMLTDLGNAERLVAIFGEDLRYVGQWSRWLIWTGRRWQEDDTGSVMRFARMTARQIYRDVKAECEQQRKMELARFAAKSESERALKAMVNLARSDKAVAIRPSDLDEKGWLLNCQNGTVELRTGKHHEHRREDMLTKIAPVEYDPNAKCDLWLRFLDEIFAGDAELIRFIQQYLGMALTGDVREQILVIFNGVGSNGKSVVIETILGLMGDYATTAAPDILTSSVLGRHPTETADLAGRRFVVSSETDEGKRMRVAFIKQATGDGAMKARRMREDFWEFQRQFKLLLVTNNLPGVREGTHAIWRRIKVVPFSQTIPDDKQDRTLVAKLRNEWPGILAWAVCGCLDWQKNGLRFPKAVELASRAYRQREDLIEQFVEDCCEMGSSPTFAVTRTAIRKAYGKWAKGIDERATLTRNAFYERLRELSGVQEHRTTSTRGFVGIRLTRPSEFLVFEERKTEEQFIRAVTQSQFLSLSQVQDQISANSNVAPSSNGNPGVANCNSTQSVGISQTGGTST
jgi:P4 family phage/plasmid primase-like protien